MLVSSYSLQMRVSEQERLHLSRTNLRDKCNFVRSTLLSRMASSQYAKAIQAFPSLQRASMQLIVILLPRPLPLFQHNRFMWTLIKTFISALVGFCSSVSSRKGPARLLPSS